MSTYHNYIILKSFVDIIIHLLMMKSVYKPLIEVLVLSYKKILNIDK